jgi:hypothetical protein
MVRSQSLLHCLWYMDSHWSDSVSTIEYSQSSRVGDFGEQTISSWNAKHRRDLDACIVSHPVRNLAMQCHQI